MVFDIVSLCDWRNGLDTGLRRYDGVVLNATPLFECVLTFALRGNIIHYDWIAAFPAVSRNDKQ